MVTNTMAGEWDMLKQTDSCLLLHNKQAPFNLTLLNYDHNNHTYIPDNFNLQQLIGNHSLNTSNPSSWFISKICDKIKLEDHQFVRGNSSWHRMNNTAPNNTYGHYD